MQSEQDLVHRAQQSDNEAYAQLYENNFDRIYQYIVLKIGNKAALQRFLTVNGELFVAPRLFCPRTPTSKSGLRFHFCQIVLLSGIRRIGFRPCQPPLYQLGIDHNIINPDIPQQSPVFIRLGDISLQANLFTLH